MTTYAKFWRRDPSGSLTMRPIVYQCSAAQSDEGLNGIGSGKVVLSQYDVFRTPPEQYSIGHRPQDGDVCVCWCLSPHRAPQHVAIFIVDSRITRGEDYEVSGPDFKAELQEAIPIAPVGFALEVTTMARSVGIRCEDNHCDVKIELDAAYRERAYVTQDVTDAGKFGILFTTRTTAQPTDTFEAITVDGQVFMTTIRVVSDGRSYVELDEPLPKALAAGSNVTIRSTRIRVDSAADFVEGQPIHYTPIPDLSNPKPGVTTGVAFVERVEEVDGEPYDYIYTADPIQDNIAKNSPLTQFQYTAPVMNDVEMLFARSPGHKWTVYRGAGATNATVYTPDNETVWDVLLALADVSGYWFRYRVSGWAADETVFRPQRGIEYWNEILPVEPSMGVIGTSNKLEHGYGEALSVETADTAEIVTHLMPRGGGGGSGEFMFHQVPGVQIGGIMGNYPSLDWGVVNNKSYIWNKNLDVSPVWREESFPHITPTETVGGDGRRLAAEQLLRASCEWLLAHAEVDTVYNVEVYTLSEPRPGDKVRLLWDGSTPTSTIAEVGLVVTSVKHEISNTGSRAGLRITTLTLSKSGRRHKAGGDVVADTLLNIKRTLRHGKFGAAGGVGIGSGGVGGGSGGDFRIESQQGGVFLRSITNNVQLSAPKGSVILDGIGVEVNAPLSVIGGLSVSGGVTHETEDGELWRQEMIVIRGIPRPLLTLEEDEVG